MYQLSDIEIIDLSILEIRNIPGGEILKNYGEAFHKTIGANNENCGILGMQVP